MMKTVQCRPHRATENRPLLDDRALFVSPHAEEASASGQVTLCF